jgi:hypothetical protein
VIGQQARKKKICQKQKKIGQNQKEKKSATNRHGRKKNEKHRFWASGGAHAPVDCGWNLEGSGTEYY